MSNQQQPAADPLLEVHDLTKHFSQQDGVLGWWSDDRIVRAVDGISFTVEEGEIFGLVGESGCGKTTTGKLITGLHEPTAGTITYRGTDITGTDTSERKQARKDIQMVFQDPFSSLNPRKTIGTMLREAMELHETVPPSQFDDRVVELLETVGLEPDHRFRRPHEFSGGQRQRVGIARALAVEPDLIVADEPVSKLDVSVQAKIINLLEELREDLGISIIFIAHDLKVVKHICDRIGVMYLGELVETGPKHDVFTEPKHPYTQSLLSAIPNIDPTMKIADKPVLEGEPPSPLDPPSGCKFHTRCPEYIGEVCEDVVPTLEPEDNQCVSCHLYDDTVEGDSEPQTYAER